MNGYLEKTDGVWKVRWYDTQSFEHGIHWMWTPLHQDNLNNPNLKEGDEVEFLIVHQGFEEQSFAPFSYAKLAKPVEERIELTLIKDLPNCPKGRIFKEDLYGNFFHSMSFEEKHNEGLKWYKFTQREIKDNSDWFQK